jgi:Transcriptional regulators containing a DNA-binding HTH domain and an aminotransferase domain (MocR family) and their eukaryotic orthologs
MKRFGIAVDADHVIITAGAQHALNCIFSSIYKPGDRIAVDTLTYPGVKTAARLCGIHLEAVDTDEEGMIPQALSVVCSRHTIKGIYTAAVMQNPTNTTMSSQRRIALANMIEKNNLILVEDDLYRFLSDEKTSTLSQLLPEQSIYIAGISKAFYCGLRISFIAAPKSLCNRIAQAVVDTQWMAPAFNAEIACECILSGTADKIILQKRAELRKRAALLKEKLSGYTFRYVPDSMFVWLKLPDYWTSREFEKTAGENRLNVISSEKFAVGNTAPPNYIRISLSGADSLEEFENGLGILLKLLSYEIGPATGIL